MRSGVVCFLRKAGERITLSMSGSEPRCAASSAAWWCRVDPNCSPTGMAGCRDQSRGNGILGEVFNAVLAALAFVRDDPRLLLVEVMDIIPEATEYGQAIRRAMRACETSGSWQEAWAACDEHYAEYNWIHVLPNACAQIIGLWWGEGDFDQTLEVICGIGHDVDCNAAQMLGVLGIMRGSGVIAPKWADPLLAGDIVTYMRRPATIPFDTLVNQTVEAARKAAR
jgi:hypothetical protein